MPALRRDSGPHCTIIPPYITREIIQRGTPHQRARALRDLSMSERFRGRREVLGELRFATPAGMKRRTIYDAKNGYDLPGLLVRGEGDPSSKDTAVNEAYKGSGSTYDFYWEVFRRKSIDGDGMRLDSTVHYGEQYDNAFWNGAQMVYGDGDGEFFNRFTRAIDVIGHELTHGVTESEGKLAYQGQPGALNESFSDVFGILVKQYVLNQKAEEASWIIGEGLFTSRVQGVGIRSMKAPGTAYDDPILGKDPQSAHMKKIYRGSDDNGGVHINSGIPNHAFYTAAMTLGGFTWKKPGAIWYSALTEYVRSRTDFKEAAEITLFVAKDLFGKGSREEKAVGEGWRKVGVLK
jgi:Zn-dependent metalloprotease